MKFNDYRDGDLVLVRVKKFSTWYRWLFAQLIRLVDGCHYHHAQRVFSGCLIEADTKLRISPIDKNAGDQILVLRLKSTLSYKELIEANVLIDKWKGEDYDYWGAMFFQLLYILSGRRIWLGSTGSKADRKFYCTEFCASLDYHLRGYFPDHYKISPSILHQKASLYYEVVYEGEA
jgi:hypothetical protein